jgi:exonuclease SbcC
MADNSISQSAMAFAGLPTMTPNEGWEVKWGGKTILDAHSESDAIVGALLDELADAKQRLASMTSAQSELQGAISELHVWAQKVVEHRHSDSNCPVCGTEFSPGKLISRMESLALAPSDVSISELRRQIEGLTSQWVHASHDGTWLEQLVKFSDVIPGNSLSSSVDTAQRAATDLQAQHNALLETRQIAQEGLDAYARAGLSLESVRELCTPVEGDERPLPHPMSFAQAYERTDELLKELHESIADLDEDLRRRDAEVRRLLDSVGIDSKLPVASAMNELLTRQRNVRRASEVINEASSFLDLLPSTDLSAICSSLEAAVLGAKKVMATLQSDDYSSTGLTKLREQLEEISRRHGRIVAAIERLTGAQRCLDDVFENLSLDAASVAVVGATHKVADSIFGRIHAPAEYQVTEDAGIPLRRRDNKAAVQLNQVSTGQRAAYALSMFLAMNAQVNEGPKVLLLDDPISHIDDLNALSFLDYLRNLLLKSDRQIFFATADERVAGLFAHKFGFLADDFKTIELTRE